VVTNIRRIIQVRAFIRLVTQAVLTAVKGSATDTICPAIFIAAHMRFLAHTGIFTIVAEEKRPGDILPVVSDFS